LGREFSFPPISSAPKVLKINQRFPGECRLSAEENSKYQLEVLGTGAEQVFKTTITDDMLALIPMCSLLSAFLVLYFDGSLRIPADPNKNMPTLVSSALSPLAACSTAVINERTHSVVALGGRDLLFDGQITSADVEYEGLILGLNCLLTMCEREAASIKNIEVTIRGDCKTVIDQMNAVSLPRKQKAYYNEALLIINKLKFDYEISLSFEHITRNLNELCDGMCKVILHHLQGSAIDNIMHSIQSVETEFRPILLPENKKKRFKFSETPFHFLLREVVGWSGHIPISLRPYILCEIALASNRTGDRVAMRQLGIAMLEEAQRLHQHNIEFKCTQVIRGLGLMGLQMSFTSLIAMELDQEAAKIAHHITQGYGAIAECITEQHLLRFQDRLPFSYERDDTIHKVMKDIASDNQYQQIQEWNDNVASHVLCGSNSTELFVFFEEL